MQNTPSRNARGVLRVATKENKNEKRQFKNTAERHKKQHRLALPDSPSFENAERIFANAEESFENTKRMIWNRRKAQKEVFKVAEEGLLAQSGLNCIGSGAPCSLCGLNRGLF